MLGALSLVQVVSEITNEHEIGFYAFVVNIFLFLEN